MQIIRVFNTILFFLITSQGFARTQTVRLDFVKPKAIVSKRIIKLNNNKSGKKSKNKAVKVKCIIQVDNRNRIDISGYKVTMFTVFESTGKTGSSKVKNSKRKKVPKKYRVLSAETASFDVEALKRIDTVKSEVTGPVGFKYYAYIAKVESDKGELVKLISPRSKLIKLFEKLEGFHKNGTAFDLKGNEVGK